MLEPRRLLGYATICGMLALAIGCVPEPNETESSAQDIYGGTADKTHPAVVLLKSGRHFCSGTIVQTDGEQAWVVTAAHCGLSADWTRWNVQYRDTAGTTQNIDVVEGNSHPSSWDGTTDVETREDMLAIAEYDVAVVRIEDAPNLPTAIPIPNLTDSLAINSPLTMIGYGYTDSSGTDTTTNGRRTTTAKVAHAPVTTPGAFDWWQGDASGVCYGDSGGAVLNQLGQLVGSVVGGDDATAVSCDNQYGIAHRVWSTLRWIHAQLAS